MATPASSGSGEKEQIETVCQLDHARAVMIVPGVMLCPLVDAEQGAKDVLVGVLTIEPDALYPFYTRPVTESLTLLQGSAAVDTEARRHRLAPSTPPRCPARFRAGWSTSPPPSRPSFRSRRARAIPCRRGSTPGSTITMSRLPSPGSGTASGSAAPIRPLPGSLPRALFQDLCGGNRGDWDLQGAIGRFEPGAAPSLLSRPRHHGDHDRRRRSHLHR